MNYLLCTGNLSWLFQTEKDTPEWVYDYKLMSGMEKLNEE